MLNRQANVNSLRIFLWNANGLKRHEPELLNLFTEKHIDIALISETHCTSNSKNFFPGYNIFRTDHPDGSGHGGSAIIISKKIQCQPLLNYKTNTIQATNILITLNHIPTTISAVYCPPRLAISSEHLSQFLNSLGRSFLIGGDFNAKHSQWGCRTDSTRGRLLQNIILNPKITFISPPGPTYWPSHQNRHPDILDFFLTTIPRHITHFIKNLADLACDHSPVLLNLNCEIYYNSPRPSLAKGPVNWSSFSKNLENATNFKISLKSTDQIDEAAQNLTTSIQTAVFKASYVTNTPDNSKHNILPPQIQKLIVKKRRVRSLWQRSNLPSDKRLLNYLSNLIKKLIIKHKSNFFQEKFQSLNSNDGSLWRTTKNILKIKEQATPLNGPNGELAISDKDKAELFGTHLSNIFTPHSNVNPESTHLDNIARFLDSPLPMSLPAKHTTPNEIKHLISKLKPRKSLGYDLITNKILQHLPNKTLLLLTFIYNSMLRLSHFPQIWKFSIVILIHKPGKPKHLPSSYRPISLLPVLAKLFEKIIIKRIRPLIHSNNIIPHIQFGFRASHSTIHQIHRITDKIQTSFENKEYCPGVFLDVAQAFDRVWHDGTISSIAHSISESRRLTAINHNKQVDINRKILARLIDVVCFLGKQELAFRGHRENEGSLNKGNYCEILDLLAKEE
ncbi:hypothetical protein QTP88_023174 [Uroleucon formosanum]